MEAIQPREKQKQRKRQKIHISINRPTLKNNTLIIFFNQILIRKYLLGQIQILPTPG